MTHGWTNGWTDPKSCLSQLNTKCINTFYFQLQMRTRLWHRVCHQGLPHGKSACQWLPYKSLRCFWVAPSFEVRPRCRGVFLPSWCRRWGSSARMLMPISLWFCSSHWLSRFRHEMNLRRPIVSLIVHCFCLCLRLSLASFIGSFWRCVHKYIAFHHNLNLSFSCSYCEFVAYCVGTISQSMNEKIC